MDHLQQIAVAACQLAEALPLPTLDIVVRILHDAISVKEARRQTAMLPQPHHRQWALEFLDSCASYPSASPQVISMALRTAGASACAHREAQSVELVWTGPDSEAVPFRRTEQTILQVLDSARERITLVSYAVYSIPNICGALVRAARRGVKISVIVETPDRIKGQSEYSTLLALGPEVAACAALYYWPQDKRQCHGDKVGILHVKCAVADGRWLFLSSANLTEYAFSINMELGVLVTGGMLPRHVEINFESLILSRVMEQI